jgi:hypothetical protein
VCYAANASTGASPPGSASNPRSPPGNKQRNTSRARIKWMFTTTKTRAKMGRAYPQPASDRQPQTNESSRQFHFAVDDRGHPQPPTWPTDRRDERGPVFPVFRCVGPQPAGGGLKGKIIPFDRAIDEVFDAFPAGFVGKVHRQTTPRFMDTRVASNVRLCCLMSCAEFEALLGERRKRACALIRKQAPMLAQR